MKNSQEQLILGLLHGDAKTWASARQRLNLVPPKRRMRMRYLDEFAEVRSQSSLPVPYLHSTHESVLNPLGPADISEWFYVSALSSTARSMDNKSAELQAIWFELAAARKAGPAQVRGRLGTTIALDLIASTGSTTTSGKDNPHYFDDLALVRALAVAITNQQRGDLEAALVRELSVTASHDGLASGNAFGHLVSGLLAGNDVPEAIARSLDLLDAGSWTEALVTQALEIAAAAESIEDLGLRLEQEIADHVYSYQIAAPETLALVCGYLKFAKSKTDLLLAGFLHSSRSEVLVPLLWGLAGLKFGGYIASPGPLQGLSIKAFRGVDLTLAMKELSNFVSQEGK